MISERKNRSYFGTDGIRDLYGKGLISPESFLKIGYALGKLALSYNKVDVSPYIYVAHDGRSSHYCLQSALSAGISASGVGVIQAGLLPTPALASVLENSDATLGVMITASHNAHYYNGLKFFTKSGAKFTLQEQEFIEQVFKQDIELDNIVGKIKDGSSYANKEYIKKITSYLQDFKEDTKLSFSQPFKNMKVVLDCANGAMSNIAPFVYENLGAEVDKIHCCVDGSNINFDSGSTNIEKLKERVLKTGADCGVAFDGDGDRVLMVDAKARVLDGDNILYILATNLDTRLNVKGVVSTVMSNGGLTEALSQKGIQHKKVKVGDRNVTDKMIEDKLLLGAESSGHIILAKYNKSGDGLLASVACLLEIVISNKSLGYWKESWKKHPQKLLNFSLLESSLQDRFIGYVNSKVQENNVHLYARKSGTEPVYRVLLEGSCIEKINDTARSISKKHQELLA